MPFGLSSGLFGLGQGLLSIGAGFGLSALQNEYNTQLYEQQYRDAVDMYNMQLSDQKALIADERSYNSPAAQASRLKAAGINPALQGVSNMPSAAGTAPTPQRPQMQGVDFMSILPAFGTLMESFMQMVSGMQDVERKDLENRKELTSIADDLLLSLGEDEVKRYFPEVYKGLQPDKDGLTAEQTAAALGTYGYVEAVAPRTRRKHLFEKGFGAGLTRRQAKKVARIAMQRMKSLAYAAKEQRLQADIVEDTYRETKGRSSYGFQDDGSVSDILANTIAVIAEADRDYRRATASSAQYDVSASKKESSKADSYDKIYSYIDKLMSSDNWKERVAGSVLLLLVDRMRAEASGSSKKSGLGFKFGF